MYGFWRLGVEPGAVDGRGLRVERARDGDEHEREEGRDAAEHRHDPGDEVAQQLAVDERPRARRSRSGRAARAAASLPGRPRTRSARTRVGSVRLVCAAT